MKKVIAALVGIVAAVLVVSLTVSGAKKTAAAGEWPMGLGRLAPVRRPATPAPDHRAIMRAHKTMQASARTWDDVRAQWQLVRPLWQQPDGLSTLVALNITTDLADRAATLPRPEPAWFAEVRAVDYRKRVLASMQFDTFLTASVMRQYTAVDPGAPAATRLRDHAKAPYLHLARRDFVEHQRLTAIALVNGEPPPEIAWWNQPAMMAAPNWVEVWTRLEALETKLKR